MSLSFGEVDIVSFEPLNRFLDAIAIETQVIEPTGTLSRSGVTVGRNGFAIF